MSVRDSRSRFDEDERESEVESLIESGCYSIREEIRR